MSHYFTVVILPEDTENIHEAVYRLMAPYDENKQVPEYEAECWCIGLEATRDARRAADEAYNFQPLRKAYWRLSDKVQEPPPWKEFAKEHIEGWNRVYEETLNAHPRKGMPIESCESCGGTGVAKTTYNPDSKWDWYRIGGRWDGVIRNIHVESQDNGFNFGSQHETLEMNTAPISDILKNEIVPFAIVTPDGKWHEKGTAGWFGMSYDEKEDWSKIAKAIFEQYKDGHIGVGLDCHI